MKLKTDKILGLAVVLVLLGLIFEGAYLYTHWQESPETIDKEEFFSGDKEFVEEIEEPEDSSYEQPPEDEEVDLPDYFNLDVPFIVQAPLGDWSPPFDHACEEASVLIVHYYLENKPVTPVEAAEDIREMVEFEKKTYGFYEDTSAKETAQLMRDYYEYNVRVEYDISLQDIKKELVKGNPVIAPTAGRMLGNPYFTPPGPLLHMLVIKGYTPTEFIVNDPGTRRGADFTYSYAVLEQAIHDWEDGNVETGRKAMIVVEKEESALKKPTLPQIHFSADRLEQADTLVIEISNGNFSGKLSGKLGSTSIDFFQPETSDNWVGLVGIDAKQSPGKHNLIIDFPDGYSIGKDLNIVEREFPITELVITKELEEKGYSPSQIAENITTKENTAIREIVDIYVPGPYFSGRFFYPLEKVKDVGAFGNVRKNGGIALQHLGVDLKADVGTSVYAVNNGIARFTQELTNYGKTLIIDHGLGIFSLYLHLSEFKVSVGEQVKQGDIIALSGNTGYSISPHLHFAIKLNGASVDPLRFIATTEKEMQ